MKIIIKLIRIGEQEALLDEEEKKEFSATSAMAVCESIMQAGKR